MKLVVKRNRELAPINSQNSQNENKAETIELSVPEEFESFNKKIVFITPNETVWDVIVNNEYKITNAITQYDKVDFYIWLTKEVDGESIDFRTKTKTLNFYHNEDASDEITDEEISGVNTVVNILEEEITKVDSLETELRDLITDIQNKLDNGEFDGEDGYTPQKGVDYFTEQDIEEIETDVKNDIEENVLVNYSLIAETGSKIELSINTTNYKLTAILKDKNNATICTSNEIDLPLETMVVDATYDNTTKEIVLTLQNGTTVSISVADLVSGLVSESQLQTILSNFYNKTEINNLLNNKVDKVQGKELSSNDFTDALKEKLEGLENYDDTEIKADISDIQDEQVEQNTDIENLQEENARLKATLPTTTGEGQDITLDKTAELEFIKPPLPMGNSEQVSYTGRNLFSNLNLENYTITSEGTYIESNNRLCSDYIDVTGMNDLTLGSEISTFYFGFGGIALFDENKNYITRQTSNIFHTITISTTNETKYARAFFEHNSIPSQGNVEVLNINKIQLLNGTYTIDNLPSYEPYVGVTASPNPDYPQEITNVTGDVEVKVQNKNLFDKNNVIDGYRLGSDGKNFANSGYSVTDFIKVKPNTNFYRNRAITIMEAVCLYDKDKNFISRLQNGNAFTTTENTYYIKTDVENTYLNTTQLELGSTASPYTPHKEQTLPLTLGNIDRRNTKK